jgi:two-component system chemotaxis response regulator CheY
MSNGRFLCVIDDDAVYQYTVRRNAEHAALTDRMLFFYDSEIALQYLIDHRHESSELPDVILLDINMPVMDGWAFLDEFESIARSIDKTIHLYMVTSSIYAEDVRRASSSPLVTGYLVKPIGEQELRTVMQRED